MATSVEVGTFTKDSSGTDNATQDVTTGFTPKAIILWGNYLQTSEAEAGGSAWFSLGFSDGTNQRAVCSSSLDAVTTTDVERFYRVTKCLVFGNASGTLLCHATVAFATNKFTMTWVENTDTTAARIHYFIVGGADITGVEAGTITGISGTGAQSITCSSADVKNATDDNAVVFFTGVQISTAQIDGNTVHGSLFLGMASSSLHEGVSSFSLQNGVGDGNSPTLVSTNSCIAEVYVSGVVSEADFTAFDSDGFDINWTTDPSLRDYYYLIIKGGQWEVGNGTSNTSTGTKAFTTTFQPKGVLMVSQLLTSDTSSQTTDLSFDISGADGTNESSGSVTEDDAAATTVVGRASSTTKIQRTLVSSADPPTVNGEADWSSFNATDFTLDYTNAAASAFLFIWVVCGDEAAAAGFAHSYGVIIG